MAVSSPAFADNNAVNTFSLNTVSVAATRTEQKQEDIASTVSIITDDNIEHTLSTNIRNMIRYEPGVEVGSASGDAARFGSKGFNIRGIDENRVKITVDGIDQASSFTPSGNPFQRSGRNHVDIDTMKRVEIIKGSASTLYGSDALGGVVAFTTKDPDDYLSTESDDTAGSIKLGYSSANKGLSETVSLANRTGKLESLLIYTHRDTDEQEIYDENAMAGETLDFNSDNILAKMQYQLTSEHRIGFTLENYESNSLTDLPSKLSSSSYSNYYYGDDVINRQRASIFHQWQANNTLFDSVRWSLDWQDSNVDQETHTVYGSTTPKARIKDYSHKEETLSLSSQFDKVVNDHQLTYGFEYKNKDLTNKQDTLYPNDPTSNVYDRAVPLVKGTTFGVYLQDQISFLDGNLLLTPGVRYDKFEANPTIDSTFTPPSATAGELNEHHSDKMTAHLGSVFKLTNTTSLFAQYSQGFKSPDLIDLYYSSERNYGPGSHYLTLPNPDLKPEESNSYEFGLRVNNNVGNLELTSFYNNYTNFIESATANSTFGGTTYDNVSQSRNISKVTIWGLEARGSIWLDQTIGAPEGTSLQMAIAYAKGENDTDNMPLESISPLKAVLGLSYENPNEQWGSTLNWTLVAKKEKSELQDESNVATPSYTTLDLTAYYKPIDSVTIRGGIFNLTDKKYWVYEDVRGLSASITNLNRYTQPGRNFTVSVNYNF